MSTGVLQAATLCTAPAKACHGPVSFRPVASLFPPSSYLRATILKESRESATDSLPDCLIDRTHDMHDNRRWLAGDLSVTLSRAQANHLGEQSRQRAVRPTLEIVGALHWDK